MTREAGEGLVVKAAQYHERWKAWVDEFERVCGAFGLQPCRSNPRWFDYVDEGLSPQEGFARCVDDLATRERVGVPTALPSEPSQ
ncbi:MAG: hypothetical protein KJZ75_11450 [Hyphomonadaceae bacterium]|nr:hypothetical protein [Hyphomonadaceae bacterium]